MLKLDSCSKLQLSYLAVEDLLTYYLGPNEILCDLYFKQTFPCISNF